MDDVLGDEESTSDISNESDDSMPSLEDGDDAVHLEQDLQADTEYDVGTIRLPPPSLAVKPDVSTLIPQKFVPPQAVDTPQSLFTTPIPTVNGEHVIGLNFRRFVRRTNRKEILIYTDGACLDNGQQNPRAGCGFIFRPPSGPGELVAVGDVSFRLEEQGPSGDTYPQTSNRAELRAVIGALQFRAWFGEGWTRLVIATDSEYVVNGATEWVRGWEKHGWLTAKKTPVKNRDLWVLLLKEVRKQAELGVTVLFWRVPRELNKAADEAAKKGASMEEKAAFATINGVLC
jgi:ribonuclease HI